MAAGERFQARHRHRLTKWHSMRRLVPGVEDLESRRLLTGTTITQFPIQFISAPQDVTIGSDGNVYSTDSKANGIDELNLTTHTISVYPIPASNCAPMAITSVPKGNIYFVESNLNAIGEFNLTTHVITQIPISTANSQPAGITTGLDGNIYFTERAAGKIGELNLTTNVITQTLVPGSNPQPTEITALGTATAPLLYFTLSGTNRIADLSPLSSTEPALPVPTVPVGETIYTPSGTIYTSTSPPAPLLLLPMNTITEFSQLPYAPSSIAAGSDGNLYFTESGQNKIGELIPAGEPAPAIFPNNETITDPSTGTTYSATSLPPQGYLFAKGSYAEFTIGSMAWMPDQLTGFDNSLYFTDTVTNKVGKLTPATGSNGELPEPSNASLNGGISSAPDGNLYFTATGADGVGEIDALPPTAGPISVFEVAPSSEPSGIVTVDSQSGTDVYFTEYSADEIGELSLAPGAPVSTSGASMTSFGIPTPNSEPEGIAVGPSDDIYFTESATGKIGELNTTTLGITEFPIPTLSGISPASILPLEIVDGPSNASSLYFTEAGNDEIGEISTANEAPPSSIPADETITAPDGSTHTATSPVPVGMSLPAGTITQFMIPTQNSEPVGIALGTDGNIYFTESAGDKIGELSTQPEQSLGYVAAGEAITTPDGTTYLAGTAIAAPTLPAGTITEFTIPAGNGPSVIAPGPGDNIWFALDGGGVLAYLNPETGAITDPAYSPQSFVIAGLASGPAPNYELYLTDDVHNQIGEVISIGQPIITFGPDTGSSQPPLDQPLGITVDANGTVWFTEYAGNEIGAAQISAQSAATTVLQAASAVQLSPSVSAAYPGETVEFTAVVVPSSGTTNPTGYVTFFVNGQQQPPVALSPVSREDTSSATLSIVIVNPGSQTITAVYDGDFNYATSSQSIILQGDGPTILYVHRYGVHDHPTSLVLGFSEQLVASVATNSANYLLMSAMGLPIKIASASYDSTDNTVMLRLKKKPNLHRVYELTVIGTAPGGLVGTSGLFLDGASNGSPGSDYATSITGRDLVLLKANDADPRQYRGAKLGRGEVKPDAVKPRRGGMKPGDG